MKGRKPKLIGLAKGDGDTRKIGARKFLARIAAEPKAARGLPDCPEYLVGVARRAYNFWKEELEDMGLDKRPTAIMLECAAAQYEAAVQAYEEVQRQGRVIEEPIVSRKTGEVTGYRDVKNPWVEIGNSASALVKSFCAESGLTLISLTRLAVERQDSSADELENFLNRPYTPVTEETVQ